MRLLQTTILLTITCTMMAQNIKVSSGKVIRHEMFESAFVDARHVDVWLPQDYSSEKKYAVLYMHDGQMLFDASSTWNKQEWGVDETMTQLMQNDQIRDCIVVGIWNIKDYRHSEYFPQRAWQMTGKKEQAEILKKQDAHINPKLFEKGLRADNYLRFIVQELKPFIDQTYATKADKANTFIMGSSMGGLISCYAICEYPGVFEGAICMSTHWPAVDGITLKYLKNHLPNPDTHRIYFDYGTETLDALYEPYQQKVDALMERNGFVMDKNFMSRKFEGAAHDENAWKKRLHIPLEYMLKTENR